MERFAGNPSPCASSGARHTPRRLCRGRDAANGPCQPGEVEFMAGREKRFLKTEISDSWTGGESSLSRKSFLMGGTGRGLVFK